MTTRRRTLAARFRRWLRRRPRTVLWAARECDRLVGSPQDLELAILERELSRRRALELQRLATVSARQMRLVAALGIDARQVCDAINELGRAIDRHLEAQGARFNASMLAARAAHARRRGDAAELAQRLDLAPLGRPDRFADLELDRVQGARTR